MNEKEWVWKGRTFKSRRVSEREGNAYEEKVDVVVVDGRRNYFEELME